MSNRPGELSTADFAGQQTRDPDAPVVQPDERMPADGERLAREDERDTGLRDSGLRDSGQSDPAWSDGERDETQRDDAAWGDPDRVAGHDTGSREGADVHDHGGDLPDHGAEVGAGAVADAGTGSLLASGDAEGFRARWTDVQTSFVDSPRDAVQQADGLVAEVMQHLAATFADERSNLERQWDSGDDIATDELRTAFQRYRSFFERLLST